MPCRNKLSCAHTNACSKNKGNLVEKVGYSLRIALRLWHVTPSNGQYGPRKCHLICYWNKVPKGIEQEEWWDEILDNCDCNFLGFNYLNQGDSVNENKTKSQSEIGEIVWAKFGSTNWWPSILISGCDCGKPEASDGHHWVFWFGDHKISKIPKTKIKPFKENFNSTFRGMKSKIYLKGLSEALECLAYRLQAEVEYNLTELLEWAKSGFTTQKQCSFDDSGLKIPEAVAKHLAVIRQQNRRAHEPSDCNKSKDNLHQASSIVRRGQLNIQDICIGCNSNRYNIASQHPLFNGGLCFRCKENLIETMFAIGEDGIAPFCAICSQPGELIICDNDDCLKCYCIGCIQAFVSLDAPKQIQETNPWMCCLCSMKANGLLQGKINWRKNLREFFNEERGITIPKNCFEKKESIRVLSLFDGIGTAKIVLHKLKIKVEVYYASEIDFDSVNVAMLNHNDSVKYLGGVENINEAVIADLCPFDLVIGGSPCNDLSLVNPARKGLLDHTGTGSLFFDYFRILANVKSHNKGNQVFWLFENVAAMPREYKSIISHFFECKAVLLDAKDFSPQKRNRYFWGNIPGMSQYMYLENSVPVPNLDNFLIPGLNRKAMVSSVRTVTTRTNSMKQVNFRMPVTMNGTGNTLLITELEEIFGFPRHYTDVGNISLTKRQQLLGKSWSVPVITQLLSPLTSFFRTI